MANHTQERLLFPSLGRIYSHAEPWLYALLRCGFGLVMLTHGLPKLLGTGHGSMADPMAGSINLIGNVMGLPFAEELAMLVMLLETLGAMMLALGLLSRPIALAMAVEMVGICYALGPTWPWIDRGIEYPVVLAGVALYIAVRGSGRLSLDRVVGITV
ncbi:DoxX family protein [Pseudomonas sp. NPDC089554]|uniref:DoxX family protein n=1 Tax=Pseudomonas sp. NPDC089554 TaxID=3390653 RepID=UPI003D05FEF8